MTIPKSDHWVRTAACGCITGHSRTERQGKRWAPATPGQNADLTRCENHRPTSGVVTPVAAQHVRGESGTIGGYLNCGNEGET